MNVSLFIAGKMSRGRNKRGSRWSPGVTVAVVAIALSVAVMLVSVGVARGFKNAIIDKVTGFDAQITLLPTANYADTTPIITLTPRVEATIRRYAGDDAEIEAITTLPGIVRGSEDFRGLIMSSIPTSGSRQAFLRDNLKQGSIREGDENGIVLSAATARALDIAVGDKAFVDIFNDGRLRTRRLPVVAFYETGMEDYDTRVAFVTGDLLSHIASSSPHQGTAILVSDIPDSRIDDVADNINRELLIEAASSRKEPSIEVTSIHDTAARYFSWLGLLDTNVTVIISLMAIVAAFTLSAGTFIIILESTKAIGILKALGMTDGAIRRVFGYMGLRIAIAGLAIGNLVAFTLLCLQKWLHVIPLDPASYYLSYVPVELPALPIVVINVTAVITAAIVLLVPTRVICGMSPARITN